MKFNYITPPVDFLQIPFRMASTLLVRLIAPTPITPNQVTLLRGVVVMIGLALMARGQAGGFTLGAVLFYVFEVLDHVDGDLARYTSRKSRLGPLLEQFQDTIFARPANLLGAAMAVGLYRITGSLTPIWLFAACVYGRMNWMEFRDYFGWKRDIEKSAIGYKAVTGRKSLCESMVALAKVLYTWNNSFILIPALAFDLLPAPWGVYTLLAGFLVVAILNNLPWIAIVIKGFMEAAKVKLKENTTV
jgi:phosphatidylglycerophosphate synthase